MPLTISQFDGSDMKSVKAFVDKFEASQEKLNYLVLNHGISGNTPPNPNLATELVFSTY